MAGDHQLEREVQREAKLQLAEYTKMQASPEASQLLSFLFQHGLGEATNVLVIDESLCVGCDQCETACASTHLGVVAARSQGRARRSSRCTCRRRAAIASTLTA